MSISPLPKRVVLKKLRESEGQTHFHNYFVVELRFIPRSGNTIPLSLGPEKPLSV